MTQRPLWQYGLGELRAGDVAAAPYLQACMERIDALEPRLFAWAWYDPAAAVAASERTARAGEAAPLAGVPVGVKDIIDTADIPTRMGSPVYADNVPRESAAVVRRFEAAGGFVLGKTVTAELAYYTPGPTRNPWNPAHTPGGSSSGSAAAVAAGCVPVAIGTQTNGSVIRPAAFCGCVGFKPSAGRISRRGILCFSPTLDQVGVFARTVEDAAAFASVLVGADPADATTANASRVSGQIASLARAPRLIAVRTPVWSRAEAHAQAHYTAVIERLRAAGAVVEARELPDVFSRGHAMHRTIMYAEGARSFARLQDAQRARLSDAINALIDEGRAITDAALAAACAARASLSQQLGTFLRDADAIVTPPATGEAPATLAATGDPAFCTLWTLCGAPALTFPSGWGPNRLPLGTQLVAAPGADERLLAVAQWCARAIGFDSGSLGKL